MKTSPLAVAGLIVLALAGCRTDPSITLLERQNRMLEDEVYRLRGALQDYEDGTSQNCVATEGADGAPVRGDAWRSRESAGPDESVGPKRGKSSSKQSLGGPVVELPGEAQPPGEVPETFRRPVGTRAPAAPEKSNAPRTPMQPDAPAGPNLPGPQGSNRTGAGRTSSVNPAGDFQLVAQADSRDVAQLVLNQMLTGGYSAAGRTGDNGVLVVIEPRDSKGRRLEAPGDVAVMLVDPSKNGREAKLARWDFPAVETAKLFRGSGIARGMYVECPWPERQPDNNSLHLYVRYTTRDGRKLEADQYVDIALPGEKAARWTPADAQSPPLAASARGLSAYRQTSAEAGDTEAADSVADDSQPDNPPPQRRARSMRTATRNNSSAVQRPTWSPERL
jgi:hypothetical protein